MSEARSFLCRVGPFDTRILAALAFFVPFLVRALPEVLMGEYLVGFDTISYYVPVALRWAHGGARFWEVVASAPLLYGLLVQLLISGVPLVVLLKVLPPVLHGFLGLSIYGYARLGFEWSLKKSLAASLLAVLYFVALRISWDMLRSELGLIFLFAFLILLGGGWESKPWRRFGLLASVGI